MYLFATIIAGFLLASVHLLNDRLFPRDEAKRVALLSMGSGFAIGYLFLRLLPKLADAQPVLLQATDGGIFGFLEHHA